LPARSSSISCTSWVLTGYSRDTQGYSGYSGVLRGTHVVLTWYPIVIKGTHGGACLMVALRNRIQEVVGCAVADAVVRQAQRAQRVEAASRNWARPLAASAPGLDGLTPTLHLPHRTELAPLAPATSAPGLGSPPAHICTGTHERVIGSSSSTSMCLSCRCVRTSEPATGLHSPGADVGQRVPTRSSTRGAHGEHAETTRRVRGDDGYSKSAPREDHASVRMECPVSTP
jgi:hypothetical protein